MGSERTGFVLLVTFITIFGFLYSTMPADLSGPGATTPDEAFTPLDPTLFYGFDDTENYTPSAFSGGEYSYDLGDGPTYYYTCFIIGAEFTVARKIVYWGIWLGQYALCKFALSADGSDRGTSLSLTEIDADDDNGTVRYTLTDSQDGTSQGGFVVVWNTTTYATAVLAFAADDLNLVHGLGVSEGSSMNILSLLVNLLLFSLPDMPFILQAMIGVPLWALIIYTGWFVIKESLPFF